MLFSRRKVADALAANRDTADLKALETGLAARLAKMSDDQRNQVTNRALDILRTKKAGHQAEAEQVLTRLNMLAREKYVTPYGIALVYAGIGDKNRAFAWLNKAVAGRSHWLVWLNRDPRWDRIRSDPRFDDLQKRVGLP